MICIIFVIAQPAARRYIRVRNNTMNFYLEKMIELGADGVDFHAFVAKPPKCYISQSNTKEDFMNGDIGTPRSGYTF